MKIPILLLLAALVSAEFEGLLNSMPADVLTGLMDQGGKETMSEMDSFKSGPEKFKSGPQKFIIATPYSPSLKAKKVLKGVKLAPIKK